MKAQVLPLTGYNALELNQKGHSKLVKGAAEKRLQMAKTIHRCFMQTEDGKKTLEYLKAWSLTRPVAVPGQDPSHAYFREGENNIVRSILEAIEEAENE